MIKIKNSKLLKLLVLLIDIILVLYLIRECKITHFCCTIINLISPIFIGYIISWIIKPLVNKLNNKFNINISIIITYLIILILLILFCYLLVPFIIKEVINILPLLKNIYNKLPYEYIKNININRISSKIINITISIKDIILNIFYSLFISYYFLRDNKKITKFISKYTPSKLINEISSNLRLFVKGTLLDTIILFIMTLISLYITNIPYAILLSIFISITNIIPYIGPYIGAIPALLVSFSISNKLIFITLILVILLQFIESSFIHPIIMSKSMNIHPITILIGLIIFGHFFGVIGMIISTPLVSIIKSLYLYYKPLKKLLKR